METSQLPYRAALLELDAHAGRVEMKDCLLFSLKSLPPTFSDDELLEQPGKGSAWQSFAHGYCLYQNTCLGCFYTVVFYSELVHMWSLLVTHPWLGHMRNRKAGNRKVQKYYNVLVG